MSLSTGLSNRRGRVGLPVLRGPVLSLLLFCAVALSQPASLTLSRDASISLLTFSPGQELYAAFGHTAFRVKDAGQLLDLTFNYGTFDFNQPDFYLNFTRGKMNYMLSVAGYDLYYRHHVATNREIREAVLDLTPEEKQRIFDALETNALPENRFYKYDFFFDNCATRPRDLLEKTLGQALVYGDFPDFHGKTMRDLIEMYWKSPDWTRLGINIGLGIPTDQPATLRNSMFIPDFLEKALLSARVQRPDGDRPLVSAHRVLNQKRPEPESFAPWASAQLLWLLLVLYPILFYAEIRRGASFPVIDAPIFFIAGLLGAVVLALWFFSDHSTVGPNLNLLWALPTHLVAAFMVFRKKKPMWLRLYFLIGGVLGVTLLLLWPYWPQRFDPSLIPLVIVLTGRSLWMALRGGDAFGVRKKTILGNALVLALVVAFLASCSPPPEPSETTSPAPRLKKVVGADGKILLLDPAGAPLPLDDEGHPYLVGKDGRVLLFSPEGEPLSMEEQPPESAGPSGSSPDSRKSDSSELKPSGQNARALASDGAAFSQVDPVKPGESAVTQKAEKSEKKLLSFALLTPAVNGEVRPDSVRLGVSYKTQLKALTPVFQFVGKQVTVDGIAQKSGQGVHDFTRPVTYVVEAEDGSRVSYLVTVERGNNPKRFLSFEFKELSLKPLINEEDRTIFLKVPFATKVQSLTVEFTATTEIVQIAEKPQASGVSKNDFTNPVVYTLTDDTGQSRDWTVRIEIAAANKNASLSRLELEGYALDPAFSPGVTGYGIKLSKNAKSIIILAVAGFEKAKVEVLVNDSDPRLLTSGKASEPLALREGDNNLFIKVTAEDKKVSQFYIVVAKRET